MPVRTRFAPSPTGYLHIGGVRTAIFNWLFARRHGGQFLLRIDDTDQERHREEALKPILHGFRWLGMQWDEGPEVGGPHAPYFQSQRSDRYRAATARLLDSGAAYRCFCTAAELDAEREAAKQAKLPYQYSRKCRRLTRDERDRRHAEGQSSVVRFAVPPDRSVSFEDLILGRVGQETQAINDFVIARADGSPLYNFASVVDDIDMKISHVIRAQEHLTNTYSQWLIFEALDATMPSFAHVPYVAAPGSKEKISKRKLEPFRSLMTPDIKRKFEDLGWKENEAPNPVMMSYYEELGYLPDAMLNGLARIGWSLDDKQEKISRRELLEHFALERVNSAPASFDPDKLWWLQGEYMKDLPMEQKIDGVVRVLQKGKLIPESVDATLGDKIRRIIDATGERLKVFTDILPYGGFFFTDDVQYEADAVKKTLRKEGAVEVLTKLRVVLAETDPFDVPTIEARVRQFSEAEGLKTSAIIHPMRVALSGRSVGPGVFELAAILGRESCLMRIDQTLKMLQTISG
jgi:glutamyl/glutaminyl-tRNA synthetase